MTSSDFLYLCNEAGVLPEIALENKQITSVLKKSKQRKLNTVVAQITVATILRQQF